MSAVATIGIFASDYGFTIGVWPASFTYNGVTYKRGKMKKDRGGDVIVVSYVNADGVAIDVYND
jgi:hypothetical protein